jgi:hypothetical protein
MALSVLSTARAKADDIAVVAPLLTGVRFETSGSQSRDEVLDEALGLLDLPVFDIDRDSSGVTEIVDESSVNR